MPTAYAIVRSPLIRVIHSGDHDNMKTGTSNDRLIYFPPWEYVVSIKCVSVTTETPIIAGRGKEMGEWIKEYETGIVIDKFDKCE